MQTKLARGITNTLSPHWLAIMVLGGVSYYSSANLAKFAQWWLLSSLFLSILPWALLARGVRSGRWDDMYFRRREQRMGPLLFTSGAVVAGFAMLYLLGAPHPFKVVLSATVVGLIVGGITLRFWKLSIHTASIAGAVIITLILFGVKFAPLIALIPLVGWARIRLAHHTLGEVIGGGIMGVAIGYGVLSAMQMG